MSSTKVIFMGTGQFALGPLQYLMQNADVELLAIYTKQVDRTKSNDGDSVFQLAQKSNIPVYTPTNFRSSEALSELAALNPDLIVVADYGLILTKAVLQMPKYGCINVHPSALPRWRGAAPIQRAIMAGDLLTAVCIMRMEEGLDTGDIIIEEEYKIESHVSAYQLTNELSNLGGKMLISAIHMLKNSFCAYSVQSDHGVLYAHKLQKEDEIIDWRESSWQIHCRIRALAPRPGAYFFYHDDRIKILESHYVSGGVSANHYLEELGVLQKEDKGNKLRHKMIDDNVYMEAIAGQVLNRYLAIKCGDGGILFPKIVQKAGGKAMKIEDFILGYFVEIGAVLLGKD